MNWPLTALVLFTDSKIGLVTQRARKVKEKKKVICSSTFEKHKTDSRADF